MSRRLTSLVIAAALGCPFAWATDSGPDVRYHEGCLSVRLEHVPLDAVLAAITRETGIEVRGELREAREVSAQFDDVPLPEALDRLIASQSFVLRYGDDGRAVRVDLLRGAPATTTATVPAAAPSAPAGPLPNIAALTASQPAVVVSPHAAQVLGGSSLTMNRVIQGLRVEDPAVRSEVQGIFLRAIESDATLRQTFRGMDAAQLTSMARILAGPFGDEMLQYFSTRATDPMFRGKATSARAGLKNDPPDVAIPGG
jgi:hypothetical protein